MEGQWTEVHYGRRHKRPFRGQGYGRPGWVDRARAPSNVGGRTHFFFSPNQPAPPPGAGRYPGPSYGFWATNRQRPPGYARMGDSPQATGPEVRREAAGPRLGPLIRKMYAVIKRVHHLQHVTPGPGKQEPRGIGRVVHMLATAIKPAFPTQQTGDIFVDMARTWGQTSCQVLAEHYGKGLEGQLQELKGSLPPDWKDAFAVATRWARGNLPRITDEAIGQAEARITDLEGPVQTGTRTKTVARVPETTKPDQLVDEVQRHQVTPQGKETPKTRKGTLWRAKEVVLAKMRDSLPSSPMQGQVKQDREALGVREPLVILETGTAESDKPVEEKHQEAGANLAKTARVQQSWNSQDQITQTLGSLKNLSTPESPGHKGTGNPHLSQIRAWETRFRVLEED